MFEIPAKFTHIRVEHCAQRKNGPAPYHTINLPDGVWINIYENGQISLNSYQNDFSVTGVRNHKGGSNVYLVATPKVVGEPEISADDGPDAEHIEVFDANV